MRIHSTYQPFYDICKTRISYSTSTNILPQQVTTVMFFRWTLLSYRCAEFSLYATKVGGGMGNVIFEVISMIGIAAQSGRIPYIEDPGTNEGASKVLRQFPALMQYLKNVQQGTRCLKPTQTFYFNSKCCTYFNSTREIKYSKNETVKSYKYFQLMDVTIRNLLRSTEEVNKIANHALFPGVSNNSIQKICVHIRRGDFVHVSNVYASRANFTRASIEFVRNDTTSNVYIMSNDQKWSRANLGDIPNVFFAESKAEWPPNVEWEFSRLHCDKTLLTASASTYGWWLAYLSKGQEVYYNGNYSTPGGIETEMTSADFFPPNWKQINLLEDNNIIMSD